MSKNLTRKGLALGAVVALGSTLFAGAPAQAAGEALTVAAAKGTSTSFLSGEQFDLKVYPSAGSTFQFASTSELRWEVKNPDATAVTVTSTEAGATATATDTPAVPSTNPSSATTITVDPDAGAYTTPGGNLLGLSVGATVETTLAVTAYIENDGTAGLTAGDTVVSAPVNVKFIKQANVTAEVKITAPVEADTTVTAQVAFTNINNEQLAQGDFSLWFTKGDDSALSGTDNQIKITPGAWDTTKLGFVATTGGSNTLVKDTAVKVQAYYKNGAGWTYVAAEKIGAAATAAVTARKVATFTAEVVRSTTAAYFSSGTTNHVLRNSSFQLKATAKDNSTTPKAVAGSAVTVAVTTSATLSATAGSVVSLTINGVTYTDNAKLPGYSSGSTTIAKIATTTDADGVAKIDVTTVGFAVGQNVSAVFATENFTSTIAPISVEAEYSLFALSSNGNVASTTDGAAVSIPVVVYNQFGGTIADGYDVLATWDASGSYSAQATASTSATETSAAVVGGKATLTITDNGTGTGVHIYDLDVKKKTGNTYGSPVASIADFQIRIKAAADLVPGAISITAGATNATTKVREITGGALENATFGAFDGRNGLGTEPSLDATQSLAGTVSTLASSTAAAVLVPGTKVTFSAAGLQFKATVDGRAVYATDSISVYSDGSGAFNVVVSSNKGGKQSISVTAGSVTQLVSIDFGAALARAGKTLTLTAPATILPGRTLQVSGLLSDKYGNAVDTNQDVDASLTVSYDGPGLIVGDLPTETDADGKFTFRVLLGAFETGSATVKATYGAANGTISTSDTGDDADIIQSATIVIGAAPVVAPTAVVAISGSTGKVYVSVTNAAGKKVVVKVSAKFAKSFTGTLAKKTQVVATTKGSKKITVYVGGKLVATKTVTVK